ncbi:putative ABC transporter-associated repeat protein [Streptomyces sp. SAI-135]|uniref:TIGR03773 family transporter-associated surface protein n=1 Tax=unclassified Streptomyces TaxID=2593676 RepID=UPI002474FADC|nr:MULTISPECIES: TIGR03773 family transporter-associated surface protein [unclassified Streptomyces]MDH6514116.1 putative ABC transporter-associated repeat protein [Streptomyces sp. SAI-090]MDH6621804.1 putative ABC transporter-associated repeat protein [Streptomyces sp. SAI-135]
MRGMRRLQRIAVAVVLSATLTGGGVAVADDGTVPAPGSGLGRIAYADGALTLDPADGAHVIKVRDSGVADASAPGWDTTGVPEGAVAGDTVRWSLTGLDGPGELTVYSAEDAPLFDSADDVRDEHALPVGQVGSTRWEFSEDGTYRVIFTAEATAVDGRELSVGTVYTVAVGDTADTEETDNGEPVAEAPEDAQPLPAAGKALPQVAEADRRTALAATAASADVVSDRKILDEGHIDFAARVVADKLQIHIKDGTVSGKTTWREPSSVVLHVKPAAENTLPADDAFAFLGKGGDPVWLLDQVQQEGLLWPGWSTDNIEAGATKGGVEFSLTEVDGPGTYALYTYDAMSGATVLFNSKDGVPDSFEVPADTHAHGGWAFTKQGTYRLTFKMSGTLASGTKVSDTETVTFVVGDTDPGTVTPGDGPGKETSGTSGSPSPDTAGSATDSGSKNGSSADGADGSMASTGAGQPVLLGSAAAALTAAGAAAFLSARRRRTARG